MTLYAESSAVLRWLLGHPSGAGIRQRLASADAVVTSDITGIEVARTLLRLVATGQITGAQAAAARTTFANSAAHWKHRSCDDEVVRRASATFPVEPLRTLDAIHVATALLHSQTGGAIAVLSTDDRVRDNALALGMTVVP